VYEYQDFRPPEAPLADAPAGPLELAGRGLRLGAKMLDGLAIGAAVLVGGIPMLLALPYLSSHRGSHGAAVLVEAVASGTAFLGLAALVAWNCVWLHRHGQTLGKRAMRIRIVRGNGARATLARIFLLRFLPMSLLGAVPLLGTLATLTDLLLIFRQSRRCLHDQFADTIVVKAP